MVNEYGYSGEDFALALDRVRDGYLYVKKLRDKHFADSSSFIVFLFSRDEDINMLTLFYLPLIKKQKKVSDFLIVSPFENIEKMVKKECRCRHLFIKCSISEMKDISRFYATFREYSQNYCSSRVIINGSAYSEDEKSETVIGMNGISKKEYVAFTVCRFPCLPDDDEVNSALDFELCAKYVDWRNYKRPWTDQDEAIENLIGEGKITLRDKIIVFSFTKSTKAVIDRLEGYDITAILDNDKGLAGTTYKEIPVLFPDDFFKNKHHEEYRIIVPTRSFKVICEQLAYYGYDVNKQVFVVYTGTINNNSYDIDKAVDIIKKGKAVYDRIRSEYPDDRLYLIPYPGTGDMYLIGMYMAERLSYDNVKSGVLVVTAGSCRKIFSLFKTDTGIKDILLLKDRAEGWELLQFTKHIGYDRTNTFVINDSFDLIDIGRLRGYNDLDFNSLFRKMVFKAGRKLQRIGLVSDPSDPLFREMRLDGKRIIVLSPYTKSVKKMSMDFWEKIAHGLSDMGYEVLTNISGEEIPVNGTRGIMIPYSMLMDFMDHCKGFIGIRSGLCDLISASKVYKVIIYPEKETINFYTVKGFFGLENMYGIKQGLMEIDLKEDPEEDITEILNLFKERMNNA